MHYTNNNLLGNIINDFKINISDNTISDNENNNNTFNEIDFPLLEIGLKIKFEYDIYNATKHYYGYDLRKKLNLYLVLNLKKIIKPVLFILFIIFIILFLFTILILKKSKCSGLHIIIILLNVIAFFLAFIIFFFFIFNSKIESDRKTIIYSFSLLLSTSFYAFVYIIFFSVLNRTNIYYYLVYIIRYGCKCCKNDEPENNQENKREIYKNLNRELNEFQKKIKDYKKELEFINKEKEHIEKEIIKNNQLYEEKKKNNSNNVEININEIVEIEAEIKSLKVVNKDKIEIFNNLNSQINDIEKKINFYKFGKLNNENKNLFV